MYKGLGARRPQVTSSVVIPRLRGRGRIEANYVSPVHWGAYPWNHRTDEYPYKSRQAACEPGQPVIEEASATLPEDLPGNLGQSLHNQRDNFVAKR